MEDKDVKSGETKETITEEKTYSQKEHEGVLHDLMSERKARQAAQNEVSTTKVQLNALTEQIEELKAKMKQSEPLLTDKLIQGEDDKEVTKGELRKFEQQVRESTAKAAKEKSEREAKAKQQNDLRVKIESSVAEAKKNYNKPELVKIGLDYDSVELAAQRIIQKNPGYRAVIINSDNPGEEIYKIGKLDPDIQKIISLNKNEKILETMNNRKVDKKDLSTSSVLDGEFITPEYLLTKSPKWIADNEELVDKSQAHWNKQKK